MKSLLTNSIGLGDGLCLVAFKVLELPACPPPSSRLPVNLLILMRYFCKRKKKNLAGLQLGRPLLFTNSSILQLPWLCKL